MHSVPDMVELLADMIDKLETKNPMENLEVFEVGILVKVATDIREGIEMEFAVEFVLQVEVESGVQLVVEYAVQVGVGFAV